MRRVLDLRRYAAGAALIALLLGLCLGAPAQDFGGQSKTKKEKKEKPKDSEKVAKDSEGAMLWKLADQALKQQDKQEKAADSQRIKLAKQLAKINGVDPSHLPPEEWFEHVTNGQQVWRWNEITQKPLRDLFERVASWAGVDDGVITRDVFARYAREHLDANSQSPGKAGKNPAEELAKVFSKFDRNQDGVLDSSEMPAALRDSVQTWDTNGDQVIDLAEYSSYAAARVQHIATTTPDPAQQPEQPSPTYTQREAVSGYGQWPQGTPSWFASIDTDHDGQIGLYEWHSLGFKIADYRQFDLNDDGYLTTDEWLTWSRRQQEAGQAATWKPTRDAANPRPAPLHPQSASEPAFSNKPLKEKKLKR